MLTSVFYKIQQLVAVPSCALCKHKGVRRLGEAHDAVEIIDRHKRPWGAAQPVNDALAACVQDAKAGAVVGCLFSLQLAAARARAATA